MRHPSTLHSFTWKRASRQLGLMGLCVALACPPASNVWAQSVDTRPGGLPNLGDGAEITLGAERRLGDSIAREIYRDPDYVDDPVLGDYLQTIWQRLLASAHQRGELSDEMQQQYAWRIALIRERSINAFALPGGYLGVHLGLVAAVSSADEIASVLGHELSHVTQRHIARMMEKEGRQAPVIMAAMILGMLAASRTPSVNGMNAANAMMVGGPAAMMQSQLNFSRDMEREADRVGYGVMIGAGYEPQGFVTMFEKLQTASRLNDSGNFPYLHSHPMTTERIADAQARQQLLPPRAPLALTPLHAMMAARAQVLTSPGVDVLRTLAAQAQAVNVRPMPMPQQAGVLYAGVLAEIRLGDWVQARQNLQHLQGLQGQDVAAQRVVRLLAAELALAEGEPRQAVSLLEGTSSVVKANDRATQLLLAQSQVATQQPAALRQATQALAMWVNQSPGDALAWQLLASGYEAQGDMLRAIRAQAEARAAALDFPAAVDRLKAAQDLERQMTREGRLDRAGQLEASIIDARLRELENRRREQALER